MLHKNVQFFSTVNGARLAKAARACEVVLILARTSSFKNLSELLVF